MENGLRTQARQVLLRQVAHAYHIVPGSHKQQLLKEFVSARILPMGKALGQVIRAMDDWGELAEEHQEQEPYSIQTLRRARTSAESPYARASCSSGLSSASRR